LFARHEIIPDIEEFLKGPWRLKQRVKAVEVVKCKVSCIRRVPTYTAAAAAADAPQSRTTATVTDRQIFETTPLSTDGPTKLTVYSKFGWQTKEKNLLQLRNDAHNEVPSFADAEADADADADAGAGADAGADANQARSAQAAGSDEAALAASPTQSTTPAAVAAKEKKKKKKKKERKGKAAQRKEGEREEVSEGAERVESKNRRFVDYSNSITNKLHPPSPPLSPPPPPHPLPHIPDDDEKPLPDFPHSPPSSHGRAERNVRVDSSVVTSSSLDPFDVGYICLLHLNPSRALLSLRPQLDR